MLTLNRPEKRNALSVALRDAISDALDALATDELVKCVVITGAGTCSAPASTCREFTRAARRRRRSGASCGRRATATTTRCCGSRLPTIAAINGPALAGGFDLAILCDLRIASTTARFAHPERTFGDVVYGPLHDLVGGAVARELDDRRARADADEALACTSSTQVVAARRSSSTPRRRRSRRVVRGARAKCSMRTKAKALRRAGFGAETPTLDL